jgi:hypothetical protein
LRRTIGVLGIAGALVTVGCGGDEEEAASDPTAAFTSEVSEICFDQGVEQRDVTVDNLPFESPEEEAAHTNQITEVLLSYDDEFEAAEPPDDLADSYERYLGVRAEVAKARPGLAEAMAAEDTDALTAISEELGALRTESRMLAKEMGLEGCDAVLPEDQAQAASAVVEEFVTTTDPELACEELVYDALVEVQFARGNQDPHEVCIKDQEYFERKPDLAAKGIEVTEVTGADNVFARVDYDEVGGKFDGLASFANLYYEDDKWRIIELYALE